MNNNKTAYYIGFFISKGQKDFFKAYTYGRTTVYGAYGPQSSINKVASVTYYELDNGILKEFNRKKGIKALAEECEEFKSYVERTKRIKKDNEIEKSFEYYNEKCK